jgi:sporulation protein YlmC with PRC-barrel domain
MRSKALLAGAAAAAVLAVANTAGWAAENNAPTPANLRNNLTRMLRKSGYTDIRVVRSSFAVRARDDNGNPVVMSIGPDEFREVTTLGGTSGSAGGKDTANSSAAGRAMFVNVPARDDLSSQLIGLGIYNNDDKDIGTVRDIAFTANGRAAAYIVSVGGFLGIGGHYIAVDPSDVKVSYNDNDKTWHASMDATAGQLRHAPVFKYGAGTDSGKI